MTIAAVAAIAWGILVNASIVAAAIAWHATFALVLVVVSSMLAFVSFVAQLANVPNKIVAAPIALSWALAVVALFALIA